MSKKKKNSPVRYDEKTVNIAKILWWIVKKVWIMALKESAIVEMVLEFIRN